MGEGREDFKVEEVASGLLRVFEERILPRLLNIADESKRHLLFAGWLNTFLEERGMGRIIITGGFAVEVYTGRVYRTMDVDVMVKGMRGLLNLFSQGFPRELAVDFSQHMMFSH
jgi:Hypothetical protein SSO1635